MPSPRLSLVGVPVSALVVSTGVFFLVLKVRRSGWLLSRLCALQTRLSVVTHSASFLSSVNLSLGSVTYPWGLFPSTVVFNTRQAGSSGVPSSQVLFSLKHYSGPSPRVNPHVFDRSTPTHSEASPCIQPDVLLCDFRQWPCTRLVPHNEFSIPLRFSMGFGHREHKEGLSPLWGAPRGPRFMFDRS